MKLNNAVKYKQAMEYLRSNNICAFDVGSSFRYTRTGPSVLRQVSQPEWNAPASSVIAHLRRGVGR